MKVWVWKMFLQMQTTLVTYIENFSFDGRVESKALAEVYKKNKEKGCDSDK